MLLLTIFAFIAGVVTILSPCILPILPIVLSSTVGGGKKRPIGIIIGFVASFTFFTLFLASIVNATGVSATNIRYFSIIVIGFFGFSLLIPQFQAYTEKLFVSLSSKIPQVKSNEGGYWSGFLIGLSIGLLWTPCVGPILAAVISLALTGSVSGGAVIITLAYAIGTAIPMFIILLTGRALFNKVPWLLSNTGKIQKVFGVFMILTATGIYFNVDRDFQAYVLEKFPQWGQGLTSFEDNDAIRNKLDNLENQEKPSTLFNFDMSQKKAPEIISGGEWFNLNGQNPPTLSQLQTENKVVLIDFWTYTCINCIRTLPYLRSWHEKYSDDGLVIIGVHSPEFEFEKDADNVAKAIADFELEYLVVQDNNFATWRAYNNRYWPAKYLVNHKGEIVYEHFGEGEYDETEAQIQKALEEANSVEISDEISNETYSNYAQTPELYFGYSRIFLPAINEDISTDKLKTYTLKEPFPANKVGYEGQWLISEEYAQAKRGSKMQLKFSAKNVFIVMKIDPELSTTTAKVKVKINGNEQNIITVDEDKLYTIVELEEPSTNLLELEFLDDGVQLYAATFG